MIIGFVMCVCFSVHLSFHIELGSHWTDFNEI